MDDVLYYKTPPLFITNFSTVTPSPMVNPDLWPKAPKSDVQVEYSTKFTEDCYT